MQSSSIYIRPVGEGGTPFQNEQLYVTLSLQEGHQKNLMSFAIH